MNRYGKLILASILAGAPLLVPRAVLSQARTTLDSIVFTRGPANYEGGELRLAVLLAAQASADQFVARLPRSVAPDHIVLQEVRRFGPHVRVFRAFAENLPDWPPHIGAVVDSAALRLGGFEETDLLRLTRIVSQLRFSGDLENDWEVARLLVELLDESGASRLCFPSEPEPECEAILEAWLDGRPIGWSPDQRSLHMRGGAIRITVLSLDSRAYTQVFHPILYSFQFGPEGQVLAWTRRRAESLKP